MEMFKAFPFEQVCTTDESLMGPFDLSLKSNGVPIPCQAEEYTQEVPLNLTLSSTSNLERSEENMRSVYHEKQSLDFEDEDEPIDYTIKTSSDVSSSLGDIVNYGSLTGDLDRKASQNENHLQSCNDHNFENERQQKVNSTNHVPSLMDNDVNTFTEDLLQYSKHPFVHGMSKAQRSCETKRRMNNGFRSNATMCGIPPIIKEHMMKSGQNNHLQWYPDHCHSNFKTFRQNHLTSYPRRYNSCNHSYFRGCGQVEKETRETTRNKSYTTHLSSQPDIYFLPVRNKCRPCCWKHPCTYSRDVKRIKKTKSGFTSRHYHPLTMNNHNTEESPDEQEDSSSGFTSSIREEEDHSYCKKTPPTRPKRGGKKGQTRVSSLPKMAFGVRRFSGRNRKGNVRKQCKRCSLCLNHGVMVSTRGHIGSCPYKHCNCNRCAITRARQLHMLRQQRLTRKIQRENTYKS